MMGPIGEVVLGEFDTQKPRLLIKWNEFSDEVLITKENQVISLSYQQARQIADTIRYALPEWR